MHNALIAKYNVPGPRYTSYPTVPFWNTAAFDHTVWQDRLTTAFAMDNYADGISLYIHLPYCESLCTFCACHKHITRNHAVEKPYIDALLAEWALYCDWLPERPRLAELHFGGGTPSFFSPQELQRLLTGLFELADPVEASSSGGPDFGWEGHPNNTTAAHLQTLFDGGCRRVSFGVQDYDPVVQRAIHRVQPFENVRRVTEEARAIGYTSISHDLVFGLPFQRPDSIRQTVAQTLTLRPDRIAFYSYAHVPWIGNSSGAFGQRGFQDADLPTGEAKRELYEIGRELLLAAGYVEIGMDHFALPHDSLHVALQNGTLHRNFMGYTTTRTDMLIGLGVSAISDIGTAFMQNDKDLRRYQERVLAGQFPINRGHLLTDEDSQVRQQILDIMCRFGTVWATNELSVGERTQLLMQLSEFRADGLIDFDETHLWVTPEGRPFLRNICMVFDRHLARSQRTERLFSQTV
ncbi:oxygen-independent coproporphyrinogen III oxidase [Fibrella aestuarina BUZ 2]|uniref:Coproporphyrinogen-III oxidase n=1 Tax=Fibrella aestuarina BUZ 2 TaxID=1166018 RepID=I0K8X3_9BACT|nr:oxygen-independent coproporphyrinogen III oxidase [Fibrella aestuarina]CCH00576.1 oxygen-independent coproporphyrinogen III oxidase [Fibrella aestuarina BUZ 2]